MTALFATLSAFAVSANAVAPLISTLAGRLGTPAAAFGLFLALQYLSFSTASFAGGWLKERLRLTNHHLVAAGLVVLTAAFALAPALLRSAAAIVAWIIPLGLAGGAVETFSSIEISARSTSGTSKNLCLSQCFYAAGAFAAPQIVYLCFGAGLGWESTFAVFTLFSLAVGLYFLLSSRRQLAPAAASVAAAAGAAAPIPAVVAGTAGVGAAGAGRRERLFRALFLLMLGYVLLESLTASWLAFVFETTYRLPSRYAALALVAFWSGVLLGRLAIAFLPGRLTLWPALVACSAGLFLAAAGAAAAGTLPLRFSLAFALGFFAGPIWPVLVMVTSVSCGSEKRTAAVIGIGAAGYAAGPFLGSLLLRFGLVPRYFLILAALALAVLVLCLRGRAVHRRGG